MHKNIMHNSKKTECGHLDLWRGVIAIGVHEKQEPIAAMHIQLSHAHSLSQSIVMLLLG